MIPIDPKLLNLFTLFWSLYQSEQEEPFSPSSLVSSAPADAYGAGRIDRRVDQLLLVPGRR